MPQTRATPDPDFLDRYIEAHLDRNLAELTRYASQPSIAAQGLGMEECAAIVADMLRARGFAVETLPTAGGPPVVVAEHFVVRDTRGRTRAEMGMTDGGEPVLRLNNAEGKERILMGLRPDGTIEIRLTDHRHEHRASLWLGNEGWPSLVLSGPDGNSLVRLDTGDGGGSISLRDAKGERLWSAP